jgi:hypothetical protein
VQESPPSSAFTCKPISDNDFIVKQDPSFNTGVTSSTQVTLTVVCNLQLVAGPTNSPQVVPSPSPTIGVAPVAPSPTYAAPVISPSQSTNIPAPITAPVGATGRCNDGTYSYALTHSGMCSKHGGVAQFYP